MVQERQAAGLAAQRAFAQAGEPDGVVVGLGVEAGDDAEALADAVVADHPEVHLADVGDVVIGVDADGAEQVADGEDTAAVEPAGDVVLLGENAEGPVGHRGHDLLEFVEVLGTGGLQAGVGVGHDEVAEAEFAADVFGDVVGEGLGAFAGEADAELFGHGAHAGLRGLHQEGHRGVLAADEPAEVDARVDLLHLGLVAFVDDEADVGDDADDVVLVLLVVVVGLVVAGGHQDLGAGALAKELLFFVEGVAHGGAVLLEDEFVEERKVGGIVAHGVFDQQDDAGAHLQAVVLGVELVFEELDDGDEDVRGVVPAEDIVDAGVVALDDVAVDFLREGGEQDDRGVRQELLGLA